MILVCLLGILLATIREASRMDPTQWKRMSEGSILLVPFLIMVALKLGLVMTMRARRSASDDSTKPETCDDPLP